MTVAIEKRKIVPLSEYGNRVVTCNCPVLDGGQFCRFLIFATNYRQLGLTPQYPSGTIPEKIGVCLGTPAESTAVLTPGCLMHAILENYTFAKES